MEKNWEILKHGGKNAKGLDARGFFPMVFRLDIGLKFARSDFGKPGFFRRGEISACSH